MGNRAAAAAVEGVGEGVMGRLAEEKAAEQAGSSPSESELIVSRGTVVPVGAGSGIKSAPCWRRRIRGRMSRMA